MILQALLKATTTKDVTIRTKHECFTVLYGIFLTSSSILHTKQNSFTQHYSHLPNSQQNSFLGHYALQFHKLDRILFHDTTSSPLSTYYTEFPFHVSIFLFKTLDIILFHAPPSPLLFRALDESLFPGTTTSVSYNVIVFVYVLVH